MPDGQWLTIGEVPDNITTFTSGEIDRGVYVFRVTAENSEHLQSNICEADSERLTSVELTEVVVIFADGFE